MVREIMSEKALKSAWHIVITVNAYSIFTSMNLLNLCSKTIYDVGAIIVTMFTDKETEKLRNLSKDNNDRAKISGL